MSVKDLQRKIDCDRYDRLQTGMANIRARFGNVIDAMKNRTFQKLWAESEQIKNRWGGHVPTQPPTEPKKEK